MDTNWKNQRTSSITFLILLWNYPYLAPSLVSRLCSVHQTEQRDIIFSLFFLADCWVLIVGPNSGEKFSFRPCSILSRYEVSIYLFLTSLVFSIFFRLRWYSPLFLKSLVLMLLQMWGLAYTLICLGATSLHCTSHYSIWMPQFISFLIQSRIWLQIFRWVWRTGGAWVGFLALGEDCRELRNELWQELSVWFLADLRPRGVRPRAMCLVLAMPNLLAYLYLCTNLRKQICSQWQFLVRLFSWMRLASSQSPVLIWLRMRSRSPAGSCKHRSRMAQISTSLARFCFYYGSRVLRRLIITATINNKRQLKLPPAQIAAFITEPVGGAIGSRSEFVIILAPQQQQLAMHNPYEQLYRSSVAPVSTSTSMLQAEAMTTQMLLMYNAFGGALRDMVKLLSHRYSTASQHNRPAQQQQVVSILEEDSQRSSISKSKELEDRQPIINMPTQKHSQGIDFDQYRLDLLSKDKSMHSAPPGQQTRPHRLSKRSAPPREQPKPKPVTRIEVVRGKKQRETLNGYSCSMCQNFYRALGQEFSNGTNKLCNDCSRHRSNLPPTNYFNDFSQEFGFDD